jgi:hypothetical protein
MSCHLRRSFVACVTVIALTAGLAGAARVQGQAFREDRPSVAGPEGLLGAVWDWIVREIAPEGAFGSLWGKEGWGMDPNGGAGTPPPPDGHP